MSEAVAVTRFATADALLAEVGGALAAAGARADRTLGVLLRLVEDPGYYGTPVHLALATRAGVPLALVSRTGRHPALFTDLGPDSREACAPLARDLGPGGDRVGGPDPFTASFVDALSAATGSRYAVQIRMRAFELHRVIPPRPAPGDFRQAQAADRELVVRWALAFHEAVEGDRDVEAITSYSTALLERGDIWLWGDDGVVSMAGVPRRTPRSATLSLVYTPPELRGRGYASATVAALSQHLLDAGSECCALFTDLANPTSNRIYRAIGYEPRCDFSSYAVLG